MSVRVVEFPARPDDGRGAVSKELNYHETGFRLRVLRRHLGHTQESFAAELGMTKRAYLAYERGQRGSRGWTAMLYRIMDLNLPQPVSLDWLFDGEGNHGGERNDDRPLFRFSFHTARPTPPRSAVTGRDDNVVSVEFGSAS